MINAHARYCLNFELRESWSHGMASVTHKRSVVTLERKLDVIRMLEDGKFLTCKELEGHSS